MSVPFPALWFAGRLWLSCSPYEIYCNLSATPQMSYYSGQQLMAVTHHYVVTQNYSQRTWTFPVFLNPETLDFVPLYSPQMNDANIQILLQIELEMHILCTHILVCHKCHVKASRSWTLRLFKCLLSRCSQTDMLIETFMVEKKISECRTVSSAKRESCKFLLGPQTL